MDTTSMGGVHGQKGRVCFAFRARCRSFKTYPVRCNILHQAAESGSSAVLTYLLLQRYHERGVDINLADIWRKTPLHIAAAKAPVSARFLINYGAVLDLVQEEGRAPLHYASRLSESERLASVDTLSHPYGDHINARDEVGRTPMMHMLDSPRCVELLLDRAADVHIRDNDRRNIMHLACIEGLHQILKMLLIKCPERQESSPSIKISWETPHCLHRSGIVTSNMSGYCWGERQPHLSRTHLRRSL